MIRTQSVTAELSILTCMRLEQDDDDAPSDRTL
jgi:hypothetical protein